MIVPGTENGVVTALTTFAVGVPWIVPLGIGLLGSWLASRNQNRGGTQVPPGPFADWLQTGMLPGSGGGGGGPVTTTRNETQTRNLLTMPVISAEYSPLNTLLNSTLQQRLRFPQGIPPGMEAQGLQQTNQTFDVVGQALQNKLSSSGQLGSPAGVFPQTVLEASRAGALADFRNSLPQLARQWQTEDLGLAGQVIQALGRGQRETGTVRTSGTSVSSGGGGGGGGPRFDPSGPLQYLQMQQQAQNQPGFWDRLLPVLGMLIGSGALGGGGGGGGGSASPSYYGAGYGG